MAPVLSESSIFMFVQICVLIVEYFAILANGPEPCIVSIEFASLVCLRTTVLNRYEI